MSIKTIAIPQEDFIWDPKEKKSVVAKSVSAWGGSASITLFDPACAIFSVPGISGIIGYRIEAKCAIVFGDPVCPPEDKGNLAIAFQKFCKERNLEAVYVTVSKDFANWAMKNICGCMIELGQELVFDPSNDPKQGSKGRLLRGKVNRASRLGVEVKEYKSCDLILQNQIEEVGRSWLKARKGPQIYLAAVDLFSQKFGKRWFYAEQEGKIIGVLLMNRLEVRQGWLVQLVMVTPEAPSGTSELLITSSIETLRKEKCRFLAFGVAASDFGEIVGLGKITAWLTRSIFKMIKKVFSLDGRRKYWEKFSAEAEPSFVLFSGDRIKIKAIIGLLRSLNAPL